MTDIIRIPKAELHTVCRAAFERVGVPSPDADAAADILVVGDLMGISTHGTRRVIIYCQRILDGAIVADPEITVEERSPCLAVIDGGNGMGPVVGSRGVAAAVRLAKESGMAYVGCRNSHHFGPVAPYSARACDAGMVSIMGTNTQPVMAPWGGAALAHGNNPIGVAAPRRDGPDFILDMAQSVVAFSKLRHAHEAGETIPEGWAADADGHGTTDPLAGMKGWVLPIGGHKGYGLALAVDMLSGVLSGGHSATGVNQLFRRDETPQGVAHFFIALDPARLLGEETYYAQMETFCQTIKATPPADAGDPVLVPGEPEAESMAETLEAGIPMPRERFEDIERIADGKQPRTMPDQ